MRKALLAVAMTIMCAVLLFAANDFSGDTNAVELYRFESGAMTTGTLNSNTLTASATAPAEDTSEYKEGACSADFELSTPTYYTRTDADLTTGFPFKNGSSGNKITVCYWAKYESGLTTQMSVAKYDSTNTKRCFATGIQDNGDKPYMAIGYNSGASFIPLVYTSALSNMSGSVWYHLSFTFDDTDNSWRIRVKNADLSAYDTDATGTSAQDPYVNDCAFSIGSNGTGGSPMDGQLDEVVIFKDILTVDEMDDVAAGDYTLSGAATPKRLMLLGVGKGQIAQMLVGQLFGKWWR